MRLRRTKIPLLTDIFPRWVYFPCPIDRPPARTSTAVCRVAEKNNLPCYVVPTGWKYFVNLMDSKRITLCGEESFGSGSSHIREKDGIWAILFWLSIIAATGKSVEEITRENWKKYGRSYYMRFDFEGLDTEVADKLMKDLEAKLPSLTGKEYGAYKVSQAAPFVYNDPVDGSVTKNGLVIDFSNQSKITYRLSGTGSSGATLRVYLERPEYKDLDKDTYEMVSDLLKIAMDIAEIQKRTGKTKADVVACGLKLEVPYELTWSCYEGKEKACGKCATCLDRLKAFKSNGVKDPLDYA